MNKRNLFAFGGAATLGFALIAMPASSAKPQKPDDPRIARLEQRIAELEAKLQAQIDNLTNPEAKVVDGGELEESARALVADGDALQKVELLPDLNDQETNVLMDGDGSSWLGVELHEVTSDTAKDLKLSAERGVVLGKIVADSPAAKAGLKENDVVTEINGQRVEGAAQFRRMIHEIPAGRTVQLTVWRDGRAQNVGVTLGRSEERRQSFKMFAPPAPGTPGTFAFRMPEMPEIPDVPVMEWNGNLLMGGQPRLGIDAEDLNGQLGAFFGAPDGEGILVREVNAGSAAEKAGVKAGDVITSFNGERIRTLGDLREKISAKREAKDKDRTAKLGVLRNKSEVSLSVELPAPALRAKHLLSRRTNI
ncbi:MAG TPA: PDZ domain-containing protein [Candidatus Acidoferrum sp.]|nr:PDZ domain-containing protein [Candidatus Acidoferrum sp.]